MTSSAERPVLEARGVTKSYSGTVALDGVDFRLDRGRVHALIGENGAGKSTLMKILAGIEPPTNGTVRLDGEEVHFTSAREAGSCGISMIHQELQLFPDLTVGENLFVGRERKTRWATVEWAAQDSAARRALERLGHASISPEARVGDLPLGHQQIVEIARALVHDVRVLLMDEPTSALTSAEVPILFQVIRDLSRHGVSIVYISHRLEELLAVADQITVLRDGRVAGSSASAQVDVAWIVRHMTGRDAASVKAASTSSGPIVLDVDSLSLPARSGRTALDAISFHVRAGEIVGLYGLMGAGRTELLESVLGVHHDASGQVRLDGRDLAGSEVSSRVAAGIAMVPEDRQAAGLVATMTVRENVTLSGLGRLAPRGYLSPRAESLAVQPLIDELRLKTPAIDAPVTALSGGNQQKVVLARGVLNRPRVLLLDEPTRGVDVGAKFEMLASMRRLATEGLGILFATSDLVDIQAATRVLVMARGRITAELPAAAATADALAAAASSMPSTDRGMDARH